jgi:magnesium transporter
VRPSENWIDLLDPTRDDLADCLPTDVHPRALDQLLEQATLGNDPRPTLESHGSYIFGALLVAVAVAEENLVYYQEVDVVLTVERILTVRKTPPGEREPWDPARAAQRCDAEAREPLPGEVLYIVVDDIAEAFLDLIDDLNDEIEELEDSIDSWTGSQVQRRVGELRHDILRIRQTLGPTRDAVRRIVEDRLDLEHGEAFPRAVELDFADAYDKLLRATESLDISRELVAGVREYHQAKVAHDQNEVVKRLTVIASLLLVPTFIVGVYGQNFRRIPELHWGFGYAWSWGLIVVTTIAQLVFFRWKRWL